MNSGRDEERGITQDELLDLLRQSLETENQLLRSYVMTAERIHDNDELKERLHNFAEGNAKRTKQLIDEVNKLHGE